MRQVKRRFIFHPLIWILIGMQSCMIPENFISEVEVHKDKSYVFRYEGNLASAFALAAIREGTFGPKEEADMRNKIPDIQKEPGFKEVDYIGSGRYRISVEYQGKAYQDYYFISRDLQIISILWNAEGIMEIRSWQAEKEDVRQLKTLGANLQGELKVSVHKDLQVLENNSAAIPGKNRVYNCYQWNIDPEQSGAKIRLR
jgi:hypothetical protein